MAILFSESSAEPSSAASLRPMEFASVPTFDRMSELTSARATAAKTATASGAARSGADADADENARNGTVANR